MKNETREKEARGERTMRDTENKTKEVSPSSVSAMSLQNTIAHRALKQQIIADRRQYCNVDLYSLNNDDKCAMA